MNLPPLIKFGSLAIDMLASPHFRKMAKFVMPYLTAPPSTPAAGNPPVQNSAPSSGAQTYPRLGGLEALQGLMGNPATQPVQPVQPSNTYNSPQMGNLLKMATPQNVQKVLAWKPVIKEFIGMIGTSGSNGGGGAPAATASAPVRLPAPAVHAKSPQSPVAAKHASSRQPLPAGKPQAKKPQQQARKKK